MSRNKPVSTLRTPKQRDIEFSEEDAYAVARQTRLSDAQASSLSDAQEPKRPGLLRRAGGRETVKLSIYLTPARADALEARARIHRRTMSEIVEEALERMGVSR